MSAAVFSSLLADPVFRTYGICAAVLTIKMMAASFNVTRLRFKYKAFKYDEDYVAKPKDQLSERTKEAIAKGQPAIQRAYGLHTNDMENIYVFYTIGFLYAVTSPSPAFAQGLLWTYTGARIIHSISYLAAKQPWRALSYLVNQATQGMMIYHILRTLLAY